MREILFRGKTYSSENHKWVYGTYIHLNIGEDYICDGTVWIGTKQPCKEKVESETVGQYTGLTDKNGTRIFEGDIIKHYNGDPEHEYVISSIIWNCDICKFQKRNLDGLSYEISKECEYEVIGNVHDNPELLRGEIK